MPKRTKKSCKNQLAFRCLCVKPPYARAIVTGAKVEEYRTRPTRIRGRIGIIESGSGTIIGEADLYDCTERGDWDYIWHLQNARLYETPIPYRHPFGAVVWVKLKNLTNAKTTVH